MKFLCALLAVVMLTACAFGACAEAETVAFADVAVEQAIRETLGVSADAPLTTDDLAMILEFDGEAGEIQTLEDFALCKNLESFILRGSKTPAYDLTPFAGLEKLRFFRIDGDVLNTAPVAALPELTALPPDGGVAERYILPGAQGYVGLIRPVSCQFCAGCNRLRLTADGKLKPCLHSGQELSIRGLDDEAMRAQFLRAIREKPAQHAPLDLAHQSEAGRSMNEIGG